MTDHILTERHGAVQIIRMNRPEKKNALTRAMYGAMADALASGEAEAAIRVHVILGVPGAFSSGNDLTDFMQVAVSGGELPEVFAFLSALAGTEKPVVSGVDGIAVGIGTTINLHCDLTFATPRTEFRTPFVDLGLVPEAGSSLLIPATIGHQAAFALLALGEPLVAQRAREIGLIHSVVAENELESRTIAAAEAIAAKPPEALRLSRNLMRPPRAEVMERIDAEARLFGQRLGSAEARNAFAAFFARKKA